MTGTRVASKTCAVCRKPQPRPDFMRRLGQPYFLNAGRAWPTEPLLPQTETDTCCVCFTKQVLADSRLAA